MSSRLVAGSSDLEQQRRERLERAERRRAIEDRDRANRVQASRELSAQVVTVVTGRQGS